MAKKSAAIVSSQTDSPKATAESKAVKVMESGASVTKRKYRRGPSNFNTYIFRVLKQVHSELSISKKTMVILNSFILDTFERVAAEAGRLCTYHKSKTMTARDVQAALNLVLQGQLAEHATNEAAKCVRKYREGKGLSVPDQMK
eukprot:Trichotokara_eunicae@DN6181_c0_g1_i1.p1